MFIVKLILLVFSLHLTAAEACEPVLIRITNGYILGRKSTTVTQNTTFYAFQGIPYAQAPVNDLRFRAPLPAKNWCGAYNATYDHSECIQTENYVVKGSEDCLFINVFSPDLPRTADKFKPRATIVWIHGGGFVFGNSSLGLNGADYFIDQDIVMVSFNYRLGLFGFLSTEDDACVGNYGLKDQILALQWLQQNIKYFGGDPNNITIMGESAGSASVHYLMQSDRAKGLFKGAIGESGSTLNPWARSFEPRQLAFRIGIINFIITASSTQLINRLRTFDAEQLQTSANFPTLLGVTDAINGLPFSPHIEKESPEAVVTKRSYEALKNGEFNRVPLLHGYNSLEGREAKNLPWYGYLLVGRYSLDSTKLAPRDMNANNADRDAAAKEILKYYFKNAVLTDGPQLVDFVSDTEFVRGIVKTTEFHAQYAPTYFYRFAFTGGRQHDSFQPEGVAHAEELQFLFSIPEWKQLTPEAIGMVHRMVEMWTNFAKTGNPTSSLSKYVNLQWPVSNINSSTISYMNIDVNMTVMTNPEKTKMQFWDNLYLKYGSGEYDTYK